MIILKDNRSAVDCGPWTVDGCRLWTVDCGRLSTVDRGLWTAFGCGPDCGLLSTVDRGLWTAFGCRPLTVDCGLKVKRSAVDRGLWTVFLVLFYWQKRSIFMLITGKPICIRPKWIINGFGTYNRPIICKHFFRVWL
jgi:hypothetical protein